MENSEENLESSPLLNVFTETTTPSNPASSFSEDTVVLENKDPFIGKVFGGCRLIGRVGAGAVGVVYLAQHLRLDRPVAVKLLAKGLEKQEELRQRFLMEGRILAQLEHPNIVRIYDLGEEHEQLFLILHFIDGETLEKRLRTKGKLTDVETVSIFLKVLSGLSHVHHHGLVHRDLKPQNIMLGQEQGVFLMDFSIAQFSTLPFRLTQDGSVLGTPYFMAPEQIEGERGDKRMDLYAVGMSMYISLTGVHPFLSKTLIETMQRQLNEEASPPEGVDSKLSDIICFLIRKDPEERPGNCEELVESLSKWMAYYRSTKTSEMKKDTGELQEIQSTQELKISPGLEQAFSEEEGFTCLSASNIKMAEKIRSLSTIGEYRLEKELGEGQWGVVYQVRHLKTNHIYAMKILTKVTDSNALDRFHQEIKACEKLSHSNIVDFISSSSEKGLHYFVMEFVDGVSLSKKISERSLSIRESVQIIRDCLRGLSYVHANGVLHRDLKPENIMIDSHFYPKIADFGIARDLSQEQSKLRITQEGSILGTPAYMAPEQVMGLHDTIDFRSDLYSIIACLYEMVTHKHPFEANNMQQLFYRICHHELPSPSRWNKEVHRDLETILIKGLSKKKEQRYQSADELIAELERFLNGLPILARPEERGKQVKKWVRRNKVMVAFGGVILLLFFSSFLMVHQKVLVLLFMVLILFFVSVLLILQHFYNQKESIYQATNLFAERIKDRAEIINQYLVRFKLTTETQAALAKFFILEKNSSKESRWIQNDKEGELPKDFVFSERYGRKVSYSTPVFRFAPKVNPKDHEELLSYLNHMRFYFNTLQHSGLEFSFSYIALEEGFLLGYPGLNLTNDKLDPRKRSWYVRAQNSERLIWVHPYKDAEGQGMILTCAIAIRDGTKFLGVAGFDITEDSFKKQLLEFSLSFPSFRGLYNLEGELLVSISEYQFHSVNPLPLPHRGDNLVRFQQDREHSLILCYSWIEILECFLVVVAREEDVIQQKVYQR